MTVTLICPDCRTIPSVEVADGAGRIWAYEAGFDGGRRVARLAGSTKPRFRAIGSGRAILHQPNSHPCAAVLDFERGYKQAGGPC